TRQLPQPHPPPPPPKFPRSRNQQHRAQIICGDALVELTRLPANSFDAILTDPPYSSFSTSSSGTGSRYLTSKKWAESRNRGSAGITCPDFAGEQRDPRAWLKWASLWLSECYRLAKPGALCAVFSDWRQLPNLTDAIRVAGWTWRGILVWDKTNAVRPVKGAFANQCEFIGVAFKGKPALAGIGPYPGSYFRQQAPRQRVHQVQKPLELCEWILQVSRPGGRVLDPFAGSSTSGVAALNTGRSFLGIEMTREYFEVSRRRLRQAERDLSRTDLDALAAAS
ncbi:MAG: DNA-methyltransferase, partial [Gemmataceae bacterium]